MPVWHEETRELRERGDVLMVGITQEQHPDRCALFAQWQELDWPILWDPLNLTGSKVVPRVTAIDEHGVVRFVRLSPKRVVDEFLAPDWESPGTEPENAPPVLRADLETEGEERALERAYAKLLWGEPRDYGDAIDVIERAAAAEGASPPTRFRLGVAYRLRYDSALSRPSDMQAALDAWAGALSRRIDQYIWRRRIQQYGPRLDKPYPFYDWIARARQEIEQRGEEPVLVRVELTGSEVAGRGRVELGQGAAAEEPDPEGELPRDEGLVALEVGVAPDTEGRPAARLHLALRPSKARDVHWSNDAGGVTVWLDPPAGWEVAARREELVPAVDAELSSELRTLDFEVAAEKGAAGGTLKGYALYFVCEGEQGRCLYLRHDFEVPLGGGR